MEITHDNSISFYYYYYDFFVFVSLLCETLPYSCVFDKIRMFVSSDAVKLAGCCKRSSGESKISLSMSLNNNNV